VCAVRTFLGLLEQLKQVDAYPIDEDVLEFFFEIETLATKATGDLHAFEIFDWTRSVGKIHFLSPISDKVPVQATFLAQKLWKRCGGEIDPVRARLVIAEARASFTRSELDQMVSNATYHSAADGWRSDFSVEDFAALTQRDWFDADAVARRPVASLADGSTCGNFIKWIDCDFRSVRARARSIATGSLESVAQSSVTLAELLSGIALTWIDEAAVNPSRCLGLMAEAAEAAYMSGLEDGMSTAAESAYASGFRDGLSSSIKDNNMRAVESGRLGGIERHKITAALKAWALEMAITMKGAERDIARTLAGKVPEHLKNASADPGRLIYDAMRDARRAKASKIDG
jgi:hypothetical protein